VLCDKHLFKKLKKKSALQLQIVTTPFFYGGFCFQYLALDRQALYHLSHVFNPKLSILKEIIFFFGHFSD
jgi:hypothetical protein